MSLLDKFAGILSQFSAMHDLTEWPDNEPKEAFDLDDPHKDQEFGFELGSHGRAAKAKSAESEKIEEPVEDMDSVSDYEQGNIFPRSPDWPNEEPTVTPYKKVIRPGDKVDESVD